MACSIPATRSSNGAWSGRPAAPIHGGGRSRQARPVWRRRAPRDGERRYGGLPNEEMLMALWPAHLAKAITGRKALAKNGLRYPIAPYGIQSDVRAGMGVSYAKK